MKFNKWTMGLAAVGVVSFASAARADEKMNAVQTALSGATLSGYVDTAATWRPGTDQGIGFFGGSVANTPGYRFMGNDGFSLNAVDIALDKPEDESPWAAGYHAEFMQGADAVTPGIVGLRQAYVTLRTPVGNGIDWKVGMWDTIIGYESNSDPLNPNYTRSYGYTIEPTTHTGILATYKVNDMVTVQAGIADSSNVGFGTVGVNPASFESQKAYMGDVQFMAPDGAGWMKGATLTVGVIDAAGNHTTLTSGSTSFYAGATLPMPVKALKVGAAFDFLDLHNGGLVGNPSDDSVWNIALYSSYQVTDKLVFNLRAEYLDNGNSSPVSNPIVLNSAYAGNEAEEFTATAQYNLWANVISRLEFRWDHVEHGNAFGFSSTDVSAANTSGTSRSNDFLLALNLIYQF
jgi:hypothetical protein